MVKENDLIKRSYWTYPYLAHIFWTQMCLCLKMSVTGVLVFINVMTYIFFNEKTLKPMVKSKCLCIVFIHFLLHNVCVLNSNMLDNILYLVTFTFKSAKQKNCCQNVEKLPCSLWFVAHESTIYGFSKIFIWYFFKCLWKEITFIWAPKTRYRRFLHILCYCKDAATHVHDNMI